MFTTRQRNKKNVKKMLVWLAKLAFKEEKFQPSTAGPSSPPRSISSSSHDSPLSIDRAHEGNRKRQEINGKSEKVICVFFSKIQSTNFQADSGGPSRPTRSKSPVPRQHTGVGKKGRKEGKKASSNDGTEDEREFRVVKLL